MQLFNVDYFRISECLFFISALGTTAKYISFLFLPLPTPTMHSSLTNATTNSQDTHALLFLSLLLCVQQVPVVVCRTVTSNIFV